MAQRSNLLSQTGVGHRDAAPSAVPDSDGLAHWHGSLQLGVWSGANLAGVILLTCLATRETAPVLGLSWALFVMFNVGLFGAFTHRGRRQTPGDRSLLYLGFAAIFGLSWGLGPALSVSVLDPNVLLAIAALSFAIALFAIPVFACHGYAYLLLLATYAPPTAWVLYASQGWLASAVWLVSAVPLLLGAASAYRQTFLRLAGLLENVLALPRGLQGSGAEDAREAPDFMHAVRSHIGALAHDLADLERAQAGLSALADGLIRTDAAGLVEYLNPAAEVLTGSSLAAARGRPLAEVLELEAAGDPDLAAHALAQCGETGAVQRHEAQATVRRRDGVVYGVEFAVSRIGGAGGAPSGFVVLFRDVTAKRQAARTAAWRAAYDPLTSLMNRAEFEARLARLLEADGADPADRHALCVIDIDHFGFVNETYGNGAGDRVLTSLALALRQKIRSADTLARLDGDEFGIILHDCPLDKARLLAEGLRAMAESLISVWQNTEIRIKISIGIVEIAPQAARLTDLLSTVDSACLAAKRSGGNRVLVYRADDERLRSRDYCLARIKEIETALQYDRFQLYFQPVRAIRPDAEEPSYCELLLRLQSDGGEILAPREFLKTAERYHLMPEIDRWVVKAAVDALRLGNPHLIGMDVIAINISSQSVADERFVEYVMRLLANPDVPAARLCFEIAESHLLKHCDRASFFIATVKDRGCKVALDEFGLGTHSFQLLKRLHVDYLKIDREFIRNLGYNSVDYEIVLGISRVAKTLRIKTIAEGVANLATRETLRGIGIDFVQGFLVEQPRPVTPPHTTH